MARQPRSAAGRSRAPTTTDDPFVDPLGPDPLDVGTEFEVALGSERIQAVQFQTVEIGPYSIRSTVREGESMGDAHRRVMDQCRAMRRADRDELIAEHLVDIKAAGAAARGR